MCEFDANSKIDHFRPSLHRCKFMDLHHIATRCGVVIAANAGGANIVPIYCEFINSQLWPIYCDFIAKTEIANKIAYGANLRMFFIYVFVANIVQIFGEYRNRPLIHISNFVFANLRLFNTTLDF